MDIITIFQKFPNQTDCIVHLEKIRWGDSPVCPYCGSLNNNRYPREIHRHFCNDCKTSFSVTVGTIFHHTHLPLQKWFVALSIVLNAKKGVSALQLSRDIKVNKNTAWRIYMQIRKAMEQEGDLLEGIVEMDETFIGGKPRDKKANRVKHMNKKIPVIGMIEREGKVKAFVTDVDNVTMGTITSLAESNLNLNNTHLMTDEFRGYARMDKLVTHSKIHHYLTYVQGDIHTNTIESFWSLLKRALWGQFHHVSRRYLQVYVNEICYRHNNRNTENIFALTLKKGLFIS